MPSATAPLYELSPRLGLMRRVQGKSPSLLPAWRAFRNPPPAAEALGTVTGDDGASYVIGQYADDGRVRDIYWPAANDPRAEHLAAYDPHDFTWVVRGLQDAGTDPALAGPGAFEQMHSMAERWNSELREGRAPTPYEARGYWIQRAG